MTALFVLLAGLVFGSFITCVSWRLPRGEEFIRTPSRCPSCSTKLRIPDLFPVLSWLAAKGKCRYCGAAVPARYPLTELSTGVLFLSVYATHGLTVQSLLLMLFAVCLMIMIVVDFEHFIIPDEVQWALLVLGVAYQLFIAVPVEGILVGFALGLGLGLALCYGYKYLRNKEGLGFGDVKFLAVAGLWLGWKAMVPFLFYSGLLGIATGLAWRALNRGPVFPFGPALAMALFILVCWPQTGLIFWKIGVILK